MTTGEAHWLVLYLPPDGATEGEPCFCARGEDHDREGFPVPVWGRFTSFPDRVLEDEQPPQATL